MTPEQFTYWLQGFVELNGGKVPTPAQWKSIKEHLTEVFHKVTPPVEHEKPISESPFKRLKFDEKKLEEVMREMERSRTTPFCPHTTLIC